MHPSPLPPQATRTGISRRTLLLATAIAALVLAPSTAALLIIAFRQTTPVQWEGVGRYQLYTSYGSSLLLLDTTTGEVYRQAEEGWWETVAVSPDISEGWREAHRKFQKARSDTSRADELDRILDRARSPGKGEPKSADRVERPP